LHYLRLQRQSPASEATATNGDASREEDQEGNSNRTAVTKKTDSVIKLGFVSPFRYWSSRLWTSSSLRPSKLNEGSFKKPYFTASILGYIAGMIATEAAMHFADHPQPALLYLVPGVLIFVWLTAAIRGELKAMWNYTEQEEEKDKEEKSKQSTNDKAIKDNDKKTEAANGKSPIKSIFSFSRSNTASSKTDDRETSSNEKVEKLEQTFRRDPARDLVFFSVSWNKPSQGRRLSDGEPKWVVPDQVQSVSYDKGHSDKRLRTG